MNVPQPGSSMKRCAALLVLTQQSRKKKVNRFFISHTAHLYSHSDNLSIVMTSHMQMRHIIHAHTKIHHSEHTSALTSSFLCKNNFTSSTFRLNMAWTRGGWRRGKKGGCYDNAMKHENKFKPFVLSKF